MDIYLIYVNVLLDQLVSIKFKINNFVNQILIKFNKGFWSCNVFIDREIVRCCLRCACLPESSSWRYRGKIFRTSDFYGIRALVVFSTSINQKCERFFPYGSRYSRSMQASAPKTTPNNFPRPDIQYPLLILIKFFY